MSTSPIERVQPLAAQLTLSGDTLTVDLVDGRSIAVPLDWHPRLASATETERMNWRLIERGDGIHWPELDEDISVEHLLNGVASGESQHSFKRWLDARHRV